MGQRRIKITAGTVEVTAALSDSRTADAVWDALPIEGSVSTWGDEVYFRTSVAARQEDEASDVVDIGDVAYWPPGQALCLFFGPTPASRGAEVRAASPVNVVGRIIGDPSVLKGATSGQRVTVARA